MVGCVRARWAQTASPSDRVLADDQGRHLAAGGQQPVEEVAADGHEVGTDHDDVALGGPQDVARQAPPRRRQRLLVGDDDLGPAGGGGGLGHGDDVVTEAVAAVGDGDGRQPLHRRPCRDDADLPALLAGPGRGSGGDRDQFGIVGQHHALRRPRREDLAEDVVLGDPARTAGDHPHALADEQLGEPVARDDGDDRPHPGLRRRGRDGRERADRDAVGPACLDPRLDGGPDVDGVDVDVPLAAAGRVDADDHEAVPERGQPGLQADDRLLVGVGEQVLDLAARPGWGLVRCVLAGVVVVVACRGASGGRAGSVPVTVVTRASRTRQSPAPPASTTPASRRAASIAVVRSRAAQAPSAAARTTSASELSPRSTAATAASAPARATVRNVPSSGSATAA